jgi:hypothetical protein
MFNPEPMPVEVITALAAADPEVEEPVALGVEEEIAELMGFGTVGGFVDLSATDRGT